MPPGPRAVEAPGDFSPRAAGALLEDPKEALFRILGVLRGEGRDPSADGFVSRPLNGIIAGLQDAGFGGLGGV